MGSIISPKKKQATQFFPPRLRSGRIAAGQPELVRDAPRVFSNRNGKDFEMVNLAGMSMVLSNWIITRI